VGRGRGAQLQTQIIAIPLRAKPNHIQREKYGTTFPHKRGQVTGVWGKWNKEQFHKLYSPTNIIRVIKLMRMKCRTLGRELLHGAEPS
jgi:hypothetical protein